VEVTRLLPAGSKSFNEARAAVIADYQDACEKQWIAQLQKKYPVQVNKKVQKFVVRELIQKP
jgi:peptidyl-prolyl cis-trans isomerase SurA